MRSKSYEPKLFLPTLINFTEEISFSFRPKIAVLIFGKHLAAIWQHFATEFLQADVSKWAFPANADLLTLKSYVSKRPEEPATGRQTVSPQKETRWSQLYK